MLDRPDPYFSEGAGGARLRETKPMVNIFSLYGATHVLRIHVMIVCHFFIWLAAQFNV